MAARRRQHRNFDYSKRPTDHKTIFAGFRIKEEEEQKAIKGRWKKAYLAVNPSMSKFQSTEARESKKLAAEAFYDQFPELCEVPNQWRLWAMTYWMTSARSNIQRASREQTGQMRKRKRDDMDSDDTDGDDEAGTRSRRSKVPSVPLSKSAAKVNTCHDRIQKFRFCKGDSLDVVVEIDAVDLVEDSIISFERITAEATAYGALIEYKNVLFLSPRNKNYPVMTQAALNTAVREMAGYPVVVVTTKTVSTSDLPKELLELESPLVDDVVMLDRDPAVHASQSDHSGTARSEQPSPAGTQATNSNNFSLGQPDPENLRVRKDASEPTQSTDAPATSVANPLHSPTPRVLSTAPAPRDRSCSPSSLPLQRLSLTPKPVVRSNSVLGGTLDTGRILRRGTPLARSNSLLSTNRNRDSSIETPLSASSHFRSTPEEIEFDDDGNWVVPSIEGDDHGIVATPYDLVAAAGSNEDIHGSDSDSPKDSEAAALDDGKADLLHDNSDVDDGLGIDDEVDDDDLDTEDEVDDGDLDTEDEEDDDIDAMAVAMKYAKEQGAARTAHKVAEKSSVEDWTRAATLYHLKLSDLRLPSGKQCVVLPPKVGLSPTYMPFPHQLVGATEMHWLAFGPRKGGMLADVMGLGKTDSTILAWDINYRAVVKTYGKIAPGNRALDFPIPDNNGKFNRTTPHIGATFISASAQGVESWPRAWKRIMQSCAAFKHLPKAWQPRMIILHSSGSKLCEDYGGAEHGLYSGMSAADWAEVLPVPDWGKARPVYGSKAHGAKPSGWSSDSTWPTSDGATTARPTPSSTRYIIVCTYQTWRSRIAATWTAKNEQEKNWRDQMKALNKLHINHTAKRAAILDGLDRIQASWVKSKQQRNDGSGPTQAVRTGYYINSKGDTKHIQFVVDLFHAGLVVIDELHSAGTPQTLNYVQIIDPFIQNCHKRHQPGIIGITGSPLASGISVTLTFAKKALRRPGSENTSDPGVRILEDLDIPRYITTWSQVESIIKNSFRQNKHKKRSKKAGFSEVAQALSNDPNIVDMFNGFAAIIQYFFIARDYSSPDPWGKQLSLVDAKHVVRYLDIEYDMKYHRLLRQVEDTVQAAATQQWKNSIDDWEVKGKQGDPPVKPALAKADPKAFSIARILAIFPNLLNAIKTWQDAHPNDPKIIGDQCAWGNSLGGDNEVLQRALVSRDKIEKSFLWDIAEDAMEGSAKWDHVYSQTKRLYSSHSKVPHPIQELRDAGKTLQYRSKYVVVTSIRLAKALLWCRLVQCWGEKAVVLVANSADRLNAIPIWQKYYDTTTNAVDDKAFILVAGLSLICQSITLVEGNLLEGLEPSFNNGDAVQAGNRQYRIGQQHPEVYVNWLVHKGSIIEKRAADNNKVKNQFVEGVQYAKAVSPDAMDTEDTV